MFGGISTKRTCSGCGVTYLWNQGLEWDSFAVAVPECFDEYKKLLTYQDNRFGLLPLRRLLVDAYYAQHPPCLEIQIFLGISRDLRADSVQNIPIYLLSLFLAFEKNVDHERIPLEVQNIKLNIIKKKIEFLELKKPTMKYELCMYDLWDIVKDTRLSREEYTYLMLRFAEKTWDAWHEYHAFIKKIYLTHKI